MACCEKADICVIGVTEKTKLGRSIFEGIMAKCVPKMIKDTNPQI